MPRSTRAEYQSRLSILKASAANISGRIRVKKRTSSNLFRYQGRKVENATFVSLEDFIHVLDLDVLSHTLEVEGLTTYHDIVRYTLQHGYLPTIAPELKHITIGGATVGIGIESAGVHHGFVHDGLIEVDVLLPSGEVVTATATNHYKDLFAGLPNSYGTLGYVIRAKIQLVKAKPVMEVTNKLYKTVPSYVKAIKAASEKKGIEFVEGLFYTKTELYLTTAKMVDNSKAPRINIYGTTPYYKQVRQEMTFCMPTLDYIFRYDPDWFWNVPETPGYKWFRRLAPKAIRSSGFYNRYITFKHALMTALNIKPDTSEEQLIQDWEVPWAQSESLLNFALENVDIQDQPWVVLPILAQSTPSLYPTKKGELYMNLGCYCYAKRPSVDEDYYYTKIMDKHCFDLGGLKMLYSSTFVSEADFNRIYQGAKYATLKAKYDPKGHVPTLYEKAVQSQ